MPPFDFSLNYFTHDDSKRLASRQILPFLGLSSLAARLREGRPHIAPSKSRFSFDALASDALREAPPFFNWTTRRIYDVHGLLLFYDHTLPLIEGNELRVRAAASSLLRTPIWSVRAGPAINIDGLIQKAVSVARDKYEYEPVMLEGDLTVRLICYGYPKLGILCFSRKDPSSRFVVDLWDLISIRVKVESADFFRTPPEATKTIWSPYDSISPSTIGEVNSATKRNTEQTNDLPELPERIEDLPGVIAAAGGSIQAMSTTNPELYLIGQQTSFYCAAATIKMILDQHLISKTQDDIATAINTVVGLGARPEDQEAAISGLTGARFNGELDPTTTFAEGRDEILANRPFRTGGVSHARACGGFLVEGTGKQWLYIYDPFPTNVGDIYYEAFDTDLNCNYLYVKPSPYL